MCYSRVRKVALMEEYMKKITSILIAFILMLSSILTVNAANDEPEIDLIQTPDYYDSQRIKEEEEKYKFAELYLSQKIMPYAGGRKTLNVTTRKQENDYFCGPAVAQMAIEFVSKKFVSQSTLAANMGTTSKDGTLVYRLKDEIKAQTKKNYVVSHISDRYFSTPLINNIDANLPVVFHVKTKKLNDKYTFDSGHYVLGIGYYWFAQGSTGANDVTYIDPWYGAGILGRRTVSFDKMESAIKANAGYYIW